MTDPLASVSVSASASSSFVSAEKLSRAYLHGFSVNVFISLFALFWVFYLWAASGLNPVLGLFPHTNDSDSVSAAVSCPEKVEVKKLSN